MRRSASPFGRVLRAVLLLALGVALAAPFVPSAHGQARDWPSERPPPPLPAPDVQFPPYEIRTLPNGLQVVAVLHHEQPAVSMRLLVRAGSAFDPADKPGVATLLSSLLDQGTTSRNAFEIADTVDFIGGALGTGAGRDLAFANVLVMKNSFDLALDLLSDVIRNPAFAPEEIERQRQQVLSGLQVSYQDPDYLAGVAIDRLIFGFHPYGRPGSGTPESIPQITRDDLVAFHQAHFWPNNAILAIVGDVTAEEAFAGAKRVFGDWRRRDIAGAEFPAPPEPTRRVLVVDRPGAVQTEIRVGHLGIPRNHPDYLALSLAAKVLGGEGSNRLQRILRSERGLTYGASADLETFKHSGALVAETDTRTEATGEALRVTVDEFWRLQRERVSERELADAKAYLAGSFPLTIETPDAIALQVLSALFYGLDLQELQTFRERVNAVSVGDIQRVATKYLTPDRLSIVLVGDASTFVDQLRRVGFGQFERVSLPDLDLSRADFRRSDRAAEPTDGESGETGGAWGAPVNGDQDPPSADAERRARDLVSKAIASKGGVEKLQSIRSVVAQADTTIVTPQGRLSADTTTFIEYPDRYRVEARLPGRELVQTFAAGEAWIEGPLGVQDAPPAMRDEFRASVNRDIIALLRRVAAGELSVRPVADEPDADGTALSGVEISGAEIEPVRLYVHPMSGHVVRQSYRVRGAAGEELVEEQIFSDFREVEGLQVNFHAIVRRAGTVLIERQVTDFKYNVPIDPALFRKPS
jgi:zinc protease